MVCSVGSIMILIVLLEKIFAMWVWERDSDFLVSMTLRTMKILSSKVNITSDGVIVMYCNISRRYYGSIIVYRGWSRVILYLSCNSWGQYVETKQNPPQEHVFVDWIANCLLVSSSLVLICICPNYSQRCWWWQMAKRRLIVYCWGVLVILYLQHYIIKKCSHDVHCKILDANLPLPYCKMVS